MRKQFLSALVRRLALVGSIGLAASLAAAAAHGQGGGPQQFTLEDRRHDRDDDLRRADPAAVVAAELAFARAAQEKGQWTAFAEYATEDAVMFVPQLVNAHVWLKGRANPPQAVRWQPHQVWSSCDGSLAVTRGAWQRPDGSVGYFTTVWERQEKKKDGYRWVLDQGDALAEPLQAPEMIEGKVADCPPARSSGIPESDLADLERAAVGAGATVAGSHLSADRTLAFHYSVQPSGAREIAVLLFKDGRVQEVLRSEVAGE
jgi:ketosteroid isomerase-like protein